ncbi:peptide ABC transporter permease [Clostridium sp. chh4-2]|uniref:ABC transporter permease n=1 Tax=Clostridium sp. chh4-2 TaxID=2067550 RepID=UPI000CCDF198|nr:ABC transporter permease [Clostridium sp. chh4-2]PNV61506.1 peptide ABC transporter permease [Clostridium sp. chh4-2]
MKKYILKRALLMIPILIGVAILIFTLMYFVPGDPAEIILGTTATQEQVLAMRDQLGLNEPYIVRLGSFLNKLFLHGSFGNSYIYGTDVGAELMSRFPKTLILAAFSILLSALIGVPLGIRAATHANRAEDRISMFISMIGVSMPNFWLALMLVLLFSLNLGWLPSSGCKGWQYYILPVLANALGGIAGIARLTRSSMLEVIRADYVTTARAKGVSEHNVIYEHALPNALIPIITICGGRFGGQLGGTMVIETVFAIPGIGAYLINSINNRDYNAVQGSVLYIAFTFSVVMLLVDLVYAYVDPRIKAQYVGQSGQKRKKVKEVKADE